MNVGHSLFNICVATSDWLGLQSFCVVLKTEAETSSGQMWQVYIVVYSKDLQIKWRIKQVDSGLCFKPQLSQKYLLIEYRNHELPETSSPLNLNRFFETFSTEKILTLEYIIHFGRTISSTDNLHYK